MSAWKAQLYTANGATCLGKIEVPHGPECGMDFCDACGDCLACYYCGHQQFVVYEDRLDEFLAEHDGAVVMRAEG